MWIVRVALNRPYTFVVLGLLVFMLGPVAVSNTPTDIFPNINIPVISVAWTYTGLNAEELSGRLAAPYQRALTEPWSTTSSTSSPTTVSGWSIVKIYLQPGASLDTGERAGRQRVAVDAALHAGRDPAAGDHQLQRIECAGASTGRVRQRADRTGSERSVVQLPPHPADHGARRGRAAPVRRQAAAGQHQPRSPAAAVKRTRAPGRAQRGRTADPRSCRRAAPRSASSSTTSACANGNLVHGFAAAELAGSLDLCLSCKGCSSDCPGRGGHGHLQGRGAVPAVQAPAARPPAHYSLGWLPRWARLAARAPRARQRRAARPGPGRAGQAAGRDRRPAAAAAVRRADLPRLVRRPGRDARRYSAGSGGDDPPEPPGAVLLWVDTFTDYFSPEVGRDAVRVLEAAGYAVQIAAEPVCCGLTWISTGQLDGARRQLRRSWTPWTPRSPPAPPSSASSPPAPRCCAARSPSCSRTTLAPPGPRPPPARWLSCWPARPDGATRPRRRARGAQPHCHHHAVMGWHGRLSAAGPGRRRGHRGGRLLRPGRQLRCRARPLRRLDGRGRDRPAARRPRGRRPRSS